MSTTQEETITISTKESPQGTVRVINISNEYDMDIHPQHWQRIDNMKKDQSISFFDQKSHNWNVSFDGRDLLFYNRFSEFKVDKEELLFDDAF